MPFECVFVDGRPNLEISIELHVTVLNGCSQSLEQVLRAATLQINARYGATVENNAGVCGIQTERINIRTGIT